MARKLSPEAVARAAAALRAIQRRQAASQPVPEVVEACRPSTTSGRSAKGAAA